VPQTLLSAAQGGALQIESDADNPEWLKCYLILGERVFLGANTLEYLSRHLLAALTSQHFKPTYDHAGTPIAWVMSLTERHCMLYASSPFPVQYFFWMNATTDPVTWAEPLILLPAQRAAWSTTLKSLAQG
jgi:hypothetical protein